MKSVTKLLSRAICALTLAPLSLYAAAIPGLFNTGVDANRVALAAGATAIIARMTRSSMLEVIRQDYIRTARAKGLAERVTTGRHALKNALIPVVTIVGLQVGYLLGGDILIEMVFSYPGIGLAMVNGILARDFPLVQGAILLVASSYVLINLAVDIFYAYLDPRIHYE